MSKISLDNQPERGPRDAKVTIVEYSDFECPFCVRAYTTLENDVLKDYGDKVRFVFKNFPLTSIHPWAGTPPSPPSAPSSGATTSSGPCTTGSSPSRARSPRTT